MKHADGSIFVLAVRTVDNVVAQCVFVDADDDVGVWRRHTWKQLTTVTGSRTLCMHGVTMTSQNNANIA